MKNIFFIFGIKVCLLFMGILWDSFFTYAAAYIFDAYWIYVLNFLNSYEI